jgi:PAS domain S-box-containing protein
MGGNPTDCRNSKNKPLLTDILITILIIPAISIPLIVFNIIAKIRELPGPWGVLLTEIFLPVLMAILVSAVWLIYRRCRENRRLEETGLKTEKNLLKSRKRLVDILDSLDHVLWSTTIGGEEFIFMSPAAERVFGKPEHDYTELPLSWRETVHEDDWADLQESYSQVHDEGFAEFDYRIIRPGGEVRWIRDRARLIRDDEGMPLRIDGIATDITPRKTAEKELAEFQALFMSSIEQSLVGVIIADATDVRISVANSAALKIRGRTVKKLIDIKLEDHSENWQFYHADGRLFAPEDLPLSRAILEGRKLENIDVIIRRENGEERWVLVNAAPVLNAEGEIIAGVAVFPDITELKLAEEALIKSEDRYFLATSAGKVGVWDWNLETNEMYIDPVLKALIGYGDDEIVNDLDIWGTYIHPEDQNRVNIESINYLGGLLPVYEVEHRKIHKDGSIRWFVSRGNVIKDKSGRPKRVVGTEMDITELKSTEEERTRLYAAVEQSVEAVVIADTHWEMQYVNSAFEKLTGYTRSEAIGKTPHKLLRSGKHPESFYKNIDETLERGDVWTGRFINRKKNGNLFHEEVTISPVRDNNGRTTHYVTVRRDITKEAELEAQLRQAQKMEAIGQLAGGVAHDFNNILQAILGHTDFAMQNLTPLADSYEDLKQIRKASDRAAKLTRQLLAFSRRQHLNKEDIDLNRLIGDLMKMLRRVIGEDVELSVVPGLKLGTVHADPTQIEQVLVNLFVNARDAMPSGGGKITIETKNSVIDDEFCVDHPWARKGNYVSLMVSDSGSGIDPDILEHIFEPFFTTKEVGKGTGLGLAMIYGIVKQHDGFINVSSEPDLGTTFKIYLPMVNREAGFSYEHKDIQKIHGGTETILVAEDEITVRRLAVRILERHGYKVIAAVDGEDAVRKFEAHADKIDLTLLDVVMPKMSGQTVHEKIKAIKPGIRCLFSSGYSKDILNSEIKLDDQIDLIQKPYDASSLLSQIRETLDKKGEPELITE